jgi:radical SAM protein with 4Fe4S-binding SPASM domain
MIRGLDVKTICLIGGEPTVDPRFLSLVKQLSDEGYTVSVISNGVRFAKASFVRAMGDAGVGNVIVSLKGESGEGYLRNTGKKVYQEVRQGLRNLHEQSQGRFGYSLSVTLCGTLRASTEALFEAIIMSGAQQVTFDTERPIIVDNEVEYEGMSPSETAAMLVEMYPKMRRLSQHGINYHVYITHPFCLFPDGYIESLKEEGRLMSGCQMLRGSGIIIDETGRILPCNHFCRSGLGTINECASGAEYIALRNRPDVADFYRRMAAFPKRECRSCVHWNECGAGCRVQWFKYDTVAMSPKKLQD